MIGEKRRPPLPAHSRKRRFARDVGVRLVAMTLLKAGLVLLALILGTGAIAYGLNHTPAPKAASTGVVLKKLVALGDFHAEQAQFSFNFPFVVHQSTLFFTGETIQVTGTGTDDAVVDFSGLTIGGVQRTGSNSVLVFLRPPHLGTAVVNLKRTKLTETSGLFTHLSHLFEGDPNDARLALAAAQGRIAAAAAGSQLIGDAKASTRAFLVRFLGRLGYTHVAVTFS